MYMLDTNALIAWSATKKVNRLITARIQHLFVKATQQKTKIVIPTPVLAEFLMGARNAGVVWINEIERKSSILIAPFDRKAAYECSIIEAAIRATGDKRAGSEEPYQKIKIDRQIVAIAKVNNCSLIVTNDQSLGVTAQRVGIYSMKIEALEIPESEKQESLKFE